MKPTDLLSDAEFERIVQRAVALTSAPASLIESAVQLFPATPARTPLQDVVDAARAWVQAVLSFDSWAPAPHAVGVRGLPSDTRHMVFVAEGRDIDLRIVPSAGQFTLSGQVLGPDEAGEVEVRVADDAEAAPRLASLDTLGGFRIDAVPGGRYELTLLLSGERVRLPPIDVGSRQP
jgi:hypothetical protein